MWGKVAVLVAALVLAGCGGDPEESGSGQLSPSVIQTAPPRSTVASSVEPTMEGRESDWASCHPAPAQLVAMVDASFTGGEHLEHAQAIDGPESETYVAGNIFGPDGKKQSSQDTWVMHDGVLYSLTSDARKRTALPDGRDVAAVEWNWPEFTDKVNECVGAVERAENQGR